MAQIFRLFPATRLPHLGAGLMAAVTCLFLAAPVRAEPVEDLLQALRMEEMLEVMREEGVAYGAELAQDMLPGGDFARWQALLAQIYDAEKMRTVVRTGFVDALQGRDILQVTGFFDTDLGQRIIALELSARRAMADEFIEEAARETYRSLQGEETLRLEQITRFIEANDLLEANVAGALNASFRFFSGLVDGGGLAMSESDILTDVWSQEDETREDTEEWLYAFLLLAYQPLEDAELEAYIALSTSEQGRALNRALFAGFNTMYDDISYALGLAAAQMMQQQDL